MISNLQHASAQQDRQRDLALGRHGQPTQQPHGQQGQCKIHKGTIRPAKRRKPGLDRRIPAVGPRHLLPEGARGVALHKGEDAGDDHGGGKEAHVDDEEPAGPAGVRHAHVLEEAEQQARDGEFDDGEVHDAKRLGDPVPLGHLAQLVCGQGGFVAAEAVVDEDGGAGEGEVEEDLLLLFFDCFFPHRLVDQCKVG